MPPKVESVDALRAEFNSSVSIIEGKIESCKKIFSSSSPNSRTLKNRYNVVCSECENIEQLFRKLSLLDSSVSEPKCDIHISYKRILSEVEALEVDFDEFEYKDDACRFIVQIDSLSTNVISKLDSFNDFINSNDVSDENNIVARSYKQEIDKLLQSCYTILCDYGAFSKYDKDYSSKLSQYQEVCTKFDLMKIKFSKFLNVGVTSTVLGHNTNIGSNKNSKLKRLDAPIFDNTRRSFARFKADFSQIVSSEVDEVMQAVYLRTHCTTGDTKQLIENLENVTEMWKLLDDEFGRPEQLVHDITDKVSQLPKLRDGDSSGLIKFIDCLRTGFNDLKLINAESAMSNIMTIREIEYKLPEQLAFLWSDYVSNVANCVNLSNKMKKLLEFLEIQRTNASYRVNVMGRQQPKGPKSSTDIQIQSKGGNIMQSNNVKIQAHKCFHCESDHTITRKCKIFNELSVDERVKSLLNHKACFLCFQVGHQSESCTYKTESKWDPCKFCKKWHAHSICKQKHVSAGTANFPDNSDVTGDVLLPVQNIKLVNNCHGLCLWDSGATGALIRNTFAINMQLKSTPITYSLTAVDGTTSTINGFMYEVELMDIHGSIHVIHAMGIDQISSDISYTNVHKLVKLFKIEEVQPHHVQFGKGPIDLLVGMKYAGLHPVVFKVAGQCLLYKSMFGSGWMVAGSNIDSQLSSKLCINNFNVSQIKLMNLLSVDNLGLDIPAKCSKCINCPQCRFSAEMLSTQEQMENELIEQGLSLDESNCKWTASYPYLRPPADLVNNYNVCLKLFQSLEHRLSKNFVDLQDYNSQMDNMMERSVLVPLSDEYLSQWKGAVWYLPHHAVYKQSSQSTPIRIVFNSAFKDRNGVCLNDCLAKGQNCLNDLLSVLLRFREHPFVALGDISKMYNSIATTEVELNLHRVLWKELGSNEKIQIMGINCVSFGDKPAGAIAVAALRRTMSLFQHIDPIAANQITKDSYMDDCVVGAQNEVDMLSRVNSSELIASKGGLKFKVWVKVGNANLKTNNSENVPHHILGLFWDTEKDNILFCIQICVGSDSKRSKTVLNEKNIHDKFPIDITRRMCLALTNSVYDPLGLIQPIMVKLKISLRDIVIHNRKNDLSWDDKLPSNFRNVWYNHAQDLLKLNGLLFPRRLVPSDIDETKDPKLVVFSDGSTDAICAVCYICFQLINGLNKSQLVMSRVKLAPLEKLTLPRIELLGALMNARLAKYVKDCLNIKISRTYHFVDSSIILSMIGTPSVCYGEYVGTRLSEIQRKSNPDDWFWVKSSDNIADIGTHNDTSIEELNCNSIWQNGPLWLSGPEDEWPICKTLLETDLPEVKKKFIGLLSNDNTQSSNCNVNSVKTNVICTKFDDGSPEMMFNVSKYSNLRKLLRVTATVFKFLEILRNKKLNVSNEISAIDIQSAQSFWIDRIMILSKLSFHKGKFKPLCPTLKNNQVVITGRAGQEHYQYNVVDLPILVPDHPVTKLYVKFIHDQQHCGIDRTVALVRLKFWVPSCRKLAKLIKRNCYLCKILDRVRCEQVMKQLPVSRLMPGPLFSHTSLDLFGPLTIKDSVRKRVSGKCWGVLFSCHSSRVVYITLTEDYGTKSFLLALDRFMYRHGCPSYIYSDCGTQLKGASREMENMYKFNQSELNKFASICGFQWKFSPVKAPWYNACSERLIGITKKLLNVFISKQSFTFSELETMFAKISYLINSRPLFKYPDSDPHDRVGTPLDLILGRNDRLPLYDVFDNEATFSKRFQFQAQLINDFWSKWKLQTFSHLVPYDKWRTSQYNLRIGDVVHMYDKTAGKGVYKIGVVDKAQIDDDNKVRRVTVKYKVSSSPTKYKYVERAVQTLVLIVPSE